MIRIVIDNSRVVSAAGEGAANRDGRSRAERELVAFVAKILKVDLVDDVSPENLSITDLQSLLGGQRVIALRRKIKAADSFVGFIVAVILVAHGQGVCFGELIIDTRANVVTRARIGNGGAEGPDGESCGVDDLRADHVHVVDIANIGGKEEGCLLAERAAEISGVLRAVVARIGRGGSAFVEERILGVERGGAGVDGELAVPFISPGLSENLDAAVTHLVVFGGERILVDANFADGGFRGELAGGETVDVELPAVRSGGRSRQGF